MRIPIGVDVGPDKLDHCVFNGLRVWYCYYNAACTLVARGVCVVIVQTACRALHTMHAHSRTGRDVRLAKLVNSEIMWSHRPKRAMDDTLAAL